MDSDFWHRKWQANEIGFHNEEVNPLLLAHFAELSLSPGSRVFVPLCGKTRDIAWLLSRGYQVAGAELSELAVDQLFAELGVKPEIAGAGDVKHYSAPDLDIFVGDIFKLTRKALGSIDAVFDRAALVALPEKMRTRYTSHIVDITCAAPQLLLTFEYDQAAMAGPTFSVCDDEVQRHYKDSYRITAVASVDVAGGLKGKCAAKETAWLLKRSERQLS